MVAGLHLHAQFLHGANFDRTSHLKNRATLGKFRRVIEVIGLDDDVATDYILGFGIRAVLDGLPFTVDNLACEVERMPRVLQVALRAEFLEPGDPRLQGPLPLLWG